MSETSAPVLLQVCPNDHPPFTDICRYHEAAARALCWRPLTFMLAARAPAPAAEFHYVAPGEFPAALRALLNGGAPVMVLAHRYRAYRTVTDSRCVGNGTVVAVAHEFGFFARWQRRLRRRWDVVLGRPPVTFAGVSAPVRQDLMRAVGTAALLPNGIDLQRVDGQRLGRAEAQRALGIGNGDFNIGVVGRLHRKKQPGLALEALRRVAPQMPRARLIMIGDGELARELARQAAGLPVTFTGFVPGAARYLAALDLLLLPSSDEEAFGMVLLEAMAAGVPVLAAPAPGPQYVLGDTGRYFRPADAEGLAAALLSACHAAGGGGLDELAQRARRRVEQRFSVPAGAHRLQALADGRVYEEDDEPPS